ncbi:flagellar basal body rod protein FlgB [Clostridium vincentii]|uniref:Flagellar basal body rod protein FlgB n=1 Tax=Clostridium vincentii TaxID=52704 RepID=A0A2T0B6B0_9CLOT|nr:flagellar basal body rod protein FlgB [Clostridium vincentii]PRR79438.1 Flagellar basal body rod protein FlgB [Clostridium vincentii]
MTMSVLGNEGSTYNLIKEGIAASNVRSKAISNNMANINTKDYKRFNVVFEENINGTTETDLAMKTNNSKHLQSSDTNGNITVEKDESTSMRTDGNNVDLDVEKVNQAANTMKYNALVQQANGKLSTMKYVISGGN